MKHYKLSDEVLRTHLSANVFYRTDDENTLHTCVAIGKNKVKPWAAIEDFDIPLDLSDCTLISKSYFNERYEYAIDLNSY